MGWCYRFFIRHFLQRLFVQDDLGGHLVQTLFELVPILSGGLEIRLMGQRLDDVHDREKQSFTLRVIDVT